MDSFMDRLIAGRAGCTLQLRRNSCAKFLASLLGFMFPHFDTENHCTNDTLGDLLSELHVSLLALLERCGLPEAQRAVLAERFFAGLSGTYEMILDDAKAIFEGDPAAQSIDEVILAYPGFYAIAVHRIAHELYRESVPVLPRVLSEFAHERSGIDIHPGATIGSSFCIDHGTGIVIGETTTIADNVKIYQGVTLGALSVDKSFAATKRHPTIESNVVIYSGATILGGKTVVGKGSVIGGNVWLTESVPENSVVYHRSEKHVKTNESLL